MFPDILHHNLVQKRASLHPIVLILGALTVALSSALSPVPAPPPGKELSIDRVFGYYQSLQSFSADFRQVKVLKVEDLELKSSGTLSVSMGQALLWEVKEPARLAVFLDQKRLKIETGKDQAKTSTTYDLKTSTYSEKIAENMRELTGLMSFDAKAVAKDYEVKIDGDSALLIPKVPRQFRQVRLLFDKGSWISRIEIDELSGDRMLLDFLPPAKSDARWIQAWTDNG